MGDGAVQRSRWKVQRRGTDPADADVAGAPEAGQRQGTATRTFSVEDYMKKITEADKQLASDLSLNHLDIDLEALCIHTRVKIQ